MNFYNLFPDYFVNNSPFLQLKQRYLLSFRSFKFALPEWGQCGIVPFWQLPSIVDFGGKPTTVPAVATSRFDALLTKSLPVVPEVLASLASPKYPIPDKRF